MSHPVKGGDVIDTENLKASPDLRLLKLIGEAEDKFVEEAIKANKFIKIMRSKYLKTAACVLLTFAIVICSVLSHLVINTTSEGDNVEKEVIIMDEHMSYTGYSDYNTALADSTYVVYGTVYSIGEPYKRNIGEGFGYVSYEYYTPIEIELIKCIKGDVKGNKIIYNALGAEYEDKVYVYNAFDTFSLKQGDKILVFLSSVNECISPDCIITENDNGYASLADLKYKNENLTIEEHVKIIEEVYTSIYS